MVPVERTDPEYDDLTAPPFVLLPATTRVRHDRRWCGDAYGFRAAAAARRRDEFFLSPGRERKPREATGAPCGGPQKREARENCRSNLKNKVIMQDERGEVAKLRYSRDVLTRDESTTVAVGKRCAVMPAPPNHRPSLPSLPPTVYDN